MFSKRSALFDTESIYHGLNEEVAITLAILPFICTSKETIARAFAEGICMQLSTMLMGPGVSVIAYQAIKNLMELQTDYKELRSLGGFNHMITGGVQGGKDKVRISVQLVECNSFRQIWSESFDRPVTKANQFDVQDEICRIIYEKFADLLGKRSIEEVS